MAKIKAYNVLRAFPARHKESNEEVWVTRENEHLIPDMLSAARIKAGVESGALQEYETDTRAEAGALHEPAKPPASSTRKER